MGLREPCHKILGLEQPPRQGTQVLHRFRLPRTRRKPDKDRMGGDKAVLRDGQTQVKRQSEDDINVDKKHMQMAVRPYSCQVEERGIPDTDRTRADIIYF